MATFIYCSSCRLYAYNNLTGTLKRTHRAPCTGQLEGAVSKSYCKSTGNRPWQPIRYSRSQQTTLSTFYPVRCLTKHNILKRKGYVIYRKIFSKYNTLCNNYLIGNLRFQSICKLTQSFNEFSRLASYSSLTCKVLKVHTAKKSPTFY